MSWQETLDRFFPDGASVTQVEDVPENVEDSVQFLTPKLVVVEEVDGRPTVTCQVYGFEKDVTFTIEQLDEWADQVWLAKTPPGQPDFLLSNLFEGESRMAMRTARKEWYQ